MNDSDLRSLIQPDHGLSEDRHHTLKEQLMANLLTTDQPSGDPAPAPINPTKRRRSKIVAGAAIAALAVGGVVAATDLLPDVSGALPIGVCRNESSVQEIVASIEMSNGNTMDMVTTRASDDAPVNGYALAQTSPDGRSQTASGHCNEPGRASNPGDLWFTAQTQVGDDGVFIWIIGHAPDTASRVEVDLSDGDTVSIDVQNDGYFLTEVVRPGVIGADTPGPFIDDPNFAQPTNIRVFDIDGILLAEQSG